MSRYATALALLIVPAPLYAQPAEEVASFMEARWDAFDRRDAEATAAFYADDAIAINVVGDQLAGVRLAPGATHEFRFRAGEPGTYYYLALPDRHPNAPLRFLRASSAR